MNELKQLTKHAENEQRVAQEQSGQVASCLLYTSDAADERSSVDLGGRRIIKKKNKSKRNADCTHITKTQHDYTSQQQ